MTGTYQNFMGGNSNSNIEIGLEEEEADGLNTEERKRRRSEAHVFSSSASEKDNLQKDTVISFEDFQRLILLVWLSLQSKPTIKNDRP